LKVGDRLLSVDGIPLQGASHATALATLRQCSHEALFQVEYDVTIPGELWPEGSGCSEKRPRGGGQGVGGTHPHHCKGCVTLAWSQPLWAPLGGTRSARHQGSI